MFNILTDKLPKEVLIDDTEYIINWYATTMIQISILIENNPMAEINDNEAALLANKELELFYPVIPNNRHEAMSKLIEFYSFSGYSHSSKGTKKKPDFEQQRSYSYQYDSSLIYAALLQQYAGTRIESLHWFEFKAMLEGLTDDCFFVKVMQYRTMKINSEMSNEEKRFYKKMQRLYALPDNRPPEAKEKDFANALFYL